MTSKRQAQPSRGHMDLHPQNDWGSVQYDVRFDEYWVKAGGKLPPSRRDDWFDQLEAAGVDPSNDPIPPAYQSGAWRGSGSAE